MSAGFNFRGETSWRSNGSIEVYLEALADRATAQYGVANPLSEFFREALERWFTGNVIFLDEVLVAPSDCERFLHLFDAATAQLLREGAFTESGHAWIEDTLGPFRQRISEAARAS